MRSQVAFIATVMCVASACNSRAKSAKTDSSIGVAPASPSMPAAVSNRPQDVTPACPHDGKWALCSIEKRLRQAGFVVKRLDDAAPRRAGFSVKPTVYALGKSHLEVFLYADSVALSRDLVNIDTLTAGPRGAASQWGELPPVLAKSANVAAVFLTTNPRQAERLVLAISAGAPQAGSPR